MYVVNGQGDMFAFDMHERNYFIPEVAGYATIQVNSSSADGTKWVGRATGKGETMYVPLISEKRHRARTADDGAQLPQRTCTAWALSPAASPPTARLRFTGIDLGQPLDFGMVCESRTRRAMSID